MAETEETSHIDVIRREFERTARTFAERTAGRFVQMDVVAFSRVSRGARVVEVGAGTGNFLRLFADAAGRLIAVDVTPAMLLEARGRDRGMELVAADGRQLPLRDHSIDLVACAQMLHHVPDPLPLLAEMKRVAARDGYVFVVDQVAGDGPGEADAMNEMEKLRDPSHAASRTAAEFRRLLRDAGLTLVDERVAESQDTFSNWMDSREFPEDRIQEVRDFIERRGAETGMTFEASGDDFVFTRRRIMLLASPHS